MQKKHREEKRKTDLTLTGLLMEGLGCENSTDEFVVSKEWEAYDARGTGPNRKFRLPGKIKKEYPLVGYPGKPRQRIFALRLTFRVLSPRAA
jgi:hypothetical protein